MFTPECDEAKAWNHSDRGIGSITTLMKRSDRIEDVARVQTLYVLFCQFVGKHVEQDFRVRARIKVAPVLFEQFRLEFGRVR